MKVTEMKEAAEAMVLESAEIGADKEDEMRKEENVNEEAGLTVDVQEESQETEPVNRDYLLLFADFPKGLGTLEEAKEYGDWYLSGGPERSARITCDSKCDDYYRQWFGREATPEERRLDIIDFGARGFYGPWTKSVIDKYTIAPMLSDMTGHDSGIVMRFDTGTPQFGEFVNWKGEYGLPSLFGGSDFSLEVFHLISERVISEPEVRELVKAYDQRGVDLGMIFEKLLPKYDEKMRDGSNEFDFSQGATLYKLAVNPEYGTEDDFTQVIVPLIAR